MVQATAAALIALLIHFGGVDVEEHGTATMQWYESSSLQREWSLSGSAGSPGVYQFADGQELVVVERIRGSEDTYAVLQYPRVAEANMSASAVIAIVSLRRLGEDYLGTLPIDVARDSIDVAWTTRQEHEAAIDGGPPSEDSPAGTEAGDVMSGYRLHRSDFGISVTDVLSNQVMNLFFY